MRRDYYPFGEAVTSSGDEESLYQFTGKEKDSNTGLFYFGARYYDPGIGRFISVDPAHQDHSPYSYCANNPLTRTDSDGRVWDTIVDIVSVGYSAYEFAKDPSWGNAGLLAADVGGAFVPFIPSPGSVRLASKVVAHADDVIDAGKAGDKVVDATKNRVKLRKSTKEKIIENAPKTPEGDFIDPNTLKVIPKDSPYDIGHKKGHEWKRRKEMHQRNKSTRKQVIEEENNPDLYQVEDPSSNRSRKYEQKD